MAFPIQPRLHSNDDINYATRRLDGLLTDETGTESYWAK